MGEEFGLVEQFSTGEQLSTKHLFSQLLFSKHINDSLMVFIFLFTAICRYISVWELSWWFILIGSCCWALQNKIKLDFYILCYKHLCQSVFVYNNSVMPVLLLFFFSPSLGYCISLHYMSQCFCTQIYVHILNVDVPMFWVCLSFCVHSSNPSLGQSLLANW